ncbi:MAG: hypothetical protein LBH42_01130, partial [Treponema sp.]|nr:hypothetical protein [Treponema sp.]
VKDEKIFGPSIIAGAISLTPLHVKKAEEYLDGKVVNCESTEMAARLLSELIMEVTPGIFDRDYKAGVAVGVVEDVLNKLTENSM